MTIKEYLNNRFSVSNIDIYHELANNIMNNSNNELERKAYIKKLQIETDKEFLELLGSGDKIASSLNGFLNTIFTEIEKVDCGFLNRKIPPHIQKSL